MNMNKGDTVVARRDIGGFMREHVPAGTRGIIIDKTGGTYKVIFTITSMFGDKRVTLTVAPDEVG